MNLRGAFLIAVAAPSAAAFVTPRSGIPTKKYLFSPMHPDRKLPWTAQQTSSTLQYRILGNTALVNEYLYIYRTENNGIAVKTNASDASSLSTEKSIDTLASFATHEYAYEGYSYNNNERVLHLQSVIQMMQSQMEQQNRLLLEEKETTERLLKENVELQTALSKQEEEHAEAMSTLQSKYEALQEQLEKAKEKVVFPEPIYNANSVATVGQIKEWADQGDQGRLLARQALQEGRIQSHRISMSFNQRLRVKEQEIEHLKEQLVAERLQRAAIMDEQKRQTSSRPEMVGWIGQVSQVMLSYGKLQSKVPSKPTPQRSQSLFGASVNRSYNQTSSFVSG